MRSVITHYVSAFMGGFLAMSAHIYWLFGRGDWLAPQRLGDTIGNALIFAHLLALTVIVSCYNPFNHRSANVATRLILGILLGTLTWIAHLYLYLYQTQPDMTILLLAALAFVITLMVAELLSRQSNLWRTVIATMLVFVAIYTPIYLTATTYQADPTAQALLYFQADNPRNRFLIGIPFAVTIALFSVLPLFIRSSRLAEP